MQTLAKRKQVYNPIPAGGSIYYITQKVLV